MNRPLVLSVSSGKGGVGKTTIAVNLAAALGGRRVLVIDGDLGLANVDVVLGLSTRHTLREIVENGRDPAEVLVETEAGFSVLPASSGVPEMAGISHRDQEMLLATLGRLTNRFDVVIVDTAAGIGDSVLAFNDWADINLVVLTPDPTSLTDGYALIKVLHNRLQKRRFYLVINEVKSKKEGEAVFRHMTSVLTTFLQCRPQCLGIVPRDSAVTAAIRSRQPLLRIRTDCRAAKAIRAIADRITDL